MADHHGVAASELSPSEEQLSFDQLLSAFPAMQQALQSAHSSLMHGHCCARGDARLPHVFAHREGQQCKVKFLEFNWLALQGSIYPPFVNSSIWWPAGVTCLSTIQQQHDIALLEAEV